MTRLAGEVQFSHERGRVRASGEHEPDLPVMSIDGEPFPYYLKDEPRVTLDPTSGMYYVQVTIVADRVVVDLSLSDEANRAVDESLERLPRDAS